jgi:hypothetical protein
MVEAYTNLRRVTSLEINFVDNENVYRLQITTLILVSGRITFASCCMYNVHEVNGVRQIDGSSSAISAA